MKRFIIALAALAVTLAGCASAGGGGGGSGISVLQSGAHSAQKDEVFKDYHNQADLDAFLATAFDKGDAPKVSVDWNTQMVLVGFLGTRKTTGYRVAFTKYDASGDQVNVDSKIVIPCASQAAPDAHQNPFVIVAVPASTKTVNFTDPNQDYQKC